MCRFSQRKQLISLLICAPLSALLAQEPTPEASSLINFETALTRAIHNDPALRGLDTAAEAVEGQIEQAGLRPNPVVGAEVENFIGSGPFQGVEGVEVTLGITQLIETNSKRDKRSELARTERTLVDWDRELRLAAIESQVRTVFVEALVAQEALELREEQLALAERSREESARLVNAARSNQVELTRAELAVRQQQFAINQAERALQAARAKLASLWGETGESDFTVTGEIELDTDLPELSQLAALLPRSAYLAQYEGHRRNREAALVLEEARAKPNIQVFGGGRYFNEASGDGAFVAGVKIPWPLFDKNQGNIRTAKARVRAVDYEKAAIRRELFVALTDAYQVMAAAHEEAKSVERDLLPAAEQTLAETEEGYERGRFMLLSVLESRSTLFAIREIYLDALSRYASARAQIEALTRPSTIN
jgi:cobalt-zinc-cadmium efflux system outer membrane protein